MNGNSGFNLDRAFVGYEGFFAKGFSAKIFMNVETVADENGKTKFNGYSVYTTVNNGIWNASVRTF